MTAPELPRDNDRAGIRVGKSLRVSAWPSMAAGSKNEAHRNGHFMGQSSNFSVPQFKVSYQTGGWMNPKIKELYGTYDEKKADEAVEEIRRMGYHAWKTGVEFDPTNVETKKVAI